MNYSNLKFLIPCLFVLPSVSCEDDDAPVIINEDELITTVEYRLVNSNDASNVVVFRSVDPDGEGAQNPVITTNGTIRANSSYNGSVKFLNETVSPAEDITEEVRVESGEHEVFYLTSVTGVQIAKTDSDVNGNPLGLTTSLQTGAAASGNLVIVLRHEPIKPNNGTLSSAGGETDVEVNFPFVIQ